MAMAPGALRQFEETMRNLAPITDSSNNNAGQGQSPQMQTQQQPGTQPGLGSSYAPGMQPGAFGLQNPYGINPYAGQSFPAINPQQYTQFTGTGPPPQGPFQNPQGPPTNALATNQQLQQLAAQQQSMPQQPQPPGYSNLPRNYGPSPPPQQQQQHHHQQVTGPTEAYRVGYQYSNPGGQPNAAQPGAMAPANRNGPWPPPDVPQYPYPSQAPPPPGPIFVEQPNMQVVPCHLCSICGRRRSGGYHRKHPIVPGRPPILAPCNKCTRSSQRERDRRERARELREDNTITIRIDDSSSRGRIRERSSEVLYVRRHSSPSPKRIVVRRRSRAHLGVRALQEDGRRATRRSIEVRYASPSPPPVIRVRHRSDEVYESTPLAPPPPPPPAPKHRFVEVSPSPPRTRRTTRVEYREESVERRPMTDYRPRSLSPVRVPQREHRRSDDAEARLASHPAPFRTVMPDHRTYLRESEASISTDSPTRGLSPRRGILRNSEMAHETAQRRQMQESYDSMLPEVGHNRVQFVAESSRRDERRDERRETDSDRDRRRRFVDGHTSSGEDFNYRHRERHYVDTPPPAPPSPPIQDFNRMRIRTSSPPSRGYEHETRVQYSSPPSSRGFDRETRIRHVSPDGRFIEARTRHTSPRRDRTSRLRGISPDIEYQEITRTRGVERAPSPVDYSDHTESGSEESPREDLQVHRYNEYDEHQRVIGVVEQRRTRFLPKTPAETPRYSSAPPVQNYRVV